MVIKLTCAQVASLINYYIDGRLNPELAKYVEIHIQKCSHCRKKFSELEQIISECNKKKKPETSADSELIASLSAYMDNELNSGENIKVKRMTVSNPQARKQLERLYKYRSLINSAYKKTKMDSKFDCSKNVMSIINNKYDYTTNLFKEIGIIFSAVMAAVIAGIIYLSL